MKANNILGIIHSNAYDECLYELTNLRTMGSVPFGGRYRLIDFVLSNMVNCGILRIGVITKSNYNSLMDHIGMGRAWDLSRKRDGLFLLPPFNCASTRADNNRLSALLGIQGFLASSSQEYVIISDCNALGNIDYSKLIAYHTKTGADISICYTKGKAPELDNLLSFEVGENGHINKLMLGAKNKAEQNFSLNIFIMRKALLEQLLHEAETHNYTSFERDILQKNPNNLNIFGYEVKEYCKMIDSLNSYYDISLDILNPNNQKELFNLETPIFTKVRDDVPVVYGLESIAKNSLIADGCTVEGHVENSILFRGVHIGRNAVVKNSIIMQGTYIGDSCNIENVITDKNVTIKPHKNLSGDRQYPFYIAKGLVI